MTFGEKLKQLRTARFLSQQKLADELGVSQSAIAAYERNFREPDFAMIQRIADYFLVPFSSLMPSNGKEYDRDLAVQIAENLHANPKLGLLFDRSRFLSEQDLDAVLAVVNAIQRERNTNE